MIAVGRVLGVDPDEDVEQREDDEDEDRAEEPEDAEPGQLDQAPGDERQQRHDQPEQPGVALGVGPGGGVELDVGCVVMVVMRVLPPWAHSSLSNRQRSSA